LTAPARVAVEDGQAGTEERLPARTKELDDDAALATEEPAEVCERNGEMEVGLPGACEHW
jgi:hypothetical protein